MHRNTDMYINQLSAGQIQAINDYLAQKDRAIFDTPVIKFLEQITSTPESDPLNFCNKDKFILRGQIITLTDKHSVTGKSFPTATTPELLNSMYRTKMEAQRDQYSDEKFEALCSEHLDEAKTKVPYYALSLHTDQVYGLLLMLMLNSEFKPVGIEMGQLKSL